MTNIFERRITPTYAEKGTLFIGADAVAAGGFSPGAVTVLADDLPQRAFAATLNATNGLAGLRPLHKALGLQPGHSIRFVVRPSHTIVITEVIRSVSAVPRPSRSRTRRRRVYSPLGAAQKQFIAQEVARLSVIARDSHHPSRRTARFLIDTLLWCWTADGIDAAGDAGRDKLKYDLDHQLHTRRAKAHWLANGRKGTGLRHEHAVPRKEILKCLLECAHPLDDAATLELLERLCFAVIVMRDEDGTLNRFKDCMPEPWNCGAQGEARFERYRAVGLRSEIVEP